MGLSRPTSEVRRSWRIPRDVPGVVQEWRPARATRLFGVAVVAAIWIVGFLLATNPADTADRIGGIVFIVATPVVIWMFTGRPRLLLTRREVLVQNALAGYVIPLAAVHDVAPGGYGLMVGVHGRRSPVTAMAVVKANGSFLLNKRVRADAVAGILNDAAAKARGNRAHAMQVPCSGARPGRSRTAMAAATTSPSRHVSKMEPQRGHALVCMNIRSRHARQRRSSFVPGEEHMTGLG